MGCGGCGVSRSWLYEVTRSELLRDVRAAGRPPTRHTSGIPPLHGPARRVRRPERRGPAHPRRRGPPPPTASIRWVDREGRRTRRTLHAHGIVAHAAGGTSRARTQGSTRTAPSGSTASQTREPSPAPSWRPRAPARHGACCRPSPRPTTGSRLHGTVEQIRVHLPAGTAHLEEPEPAQAGTGRPSAGGASTYERTDSTGCLPRSPHRRRFVSDVRSDCATSSPGSLVALGLCPSVSSGRERCCGRHGQRGCVGVKLGA